jgi:hypothetical protein
LITAKDRFFSVIFIHRVVALSVLTRQSRALSPTMTLITFLSYLLKFFSNPALISALISLIQKLLR